MGLPVEKKEKLSEDIGKDLQKEFVRHYRNLRKHEVDKHDAAEVVSHGIRKGLEGANQEVKND